MKETDKEVKRMKRQQVYVRYQDDGPLGACGQTANITSPWDRLYIFQDYLDARKFMRKVEKSRGRKNPRVTKIWQAWDDFMEVFDCTKHGDE